MSQQTKKLGLYQNIKLIPKRNGMFCDYKTGTILCFQPSVPVIVNKISPWFYIFEPETQRQITAHLPNGDELIDFWFERAELNEKPATDIFQ